MWMTSLGRFDIDVEEPWFLDIMNQETETSLNKGLYPQSCHYLPSVMYLDCGTRKSP